MAEIFFLSVAEMAEMADGRDRRGSNLKISCGGCISLQPFVNWRFGFFFFFFSRMIVFCEKIFLCHPAILPFSPKKISEPENFCF